MTNKCPEGNGLYCWVSKSLSSLLLSLRTLFAIIHCSLGKFFVLMIIFQLVMVYFFHEMVFTYVFELGVADRCAKAQLKIRQSPGSGTFCSTSTGENTELAHHMYWKKFQTRYHVRCNNDRNERGYAIQI